MDLGLTNRVALIAAASQGLGYACPLELAREGAQIFLCSRDEDRATEAAARINRESGVKASGIACDVTEPAALEHFVAAAHRRAGRVNILVTNAGGPPASGFEVTDDEKFQIAFELTLLSAMRLTKLVLPGMRENKWGRIINITSISAKQPLDGGLLSNTMRAGLTGWAKTLANEVAIDGVTVNNIAPGYTLTEHQDELAETRGRATGKTKEEMIQLWASQAPIKRLASPGEIGAAVAFLASERASYITAITLQVDGGWIKGLL